MKSILFVLIAQMHGGGTETLAVYPNIEQCRSALQAAATNLAADYACLAAPTAGTWSQKDSRYVMAKE